MFTMHGQEPVIQEGTPVYPLERRMTNLAVPPAPPPMKALDIDPLIPLTQPSPREADP
jgi:hypothetical protein